MSNTFRKDTLVIIDGYLDATGIHLIDEAPLTPVQQLQANAYAAQWDQAARAQQQAIAALTPLQRNVWSVLTYAPQANIRDIHRVTKHATHSIRMAIAALRDAGVIDCKPYTIGTRRILIPCPSVRSS
jgi:hypothetical protein